MSTILAIDTSSAHGSVTLRRQGQPTGEHHLDAPDGFAHLLFAAIDTVLNGAGVRLASVDCFAVINGPGAFTGVRVGLAAAKGLAEANGKRCAAISTLRVLASVGTAAKRATITDARRGQVYAAVYDAELRLVLPEVVTDLRDWMMNARDVSEFIAAPEFHSIIGDVQAGAIAQSPPQRLAAALARCAELDGLAGTWTDPDAVDANYVRQPDAVRITN